MYLPLFLLVSASVATGQLEICDQTPPQSRGTLPSTNKGMYELSIVKKGNDSEDIYIPGQTYVLVLKTNNKSRPFRWFMITVESPDAENTTYESSPTNVGSLKTLDSNRQSRYSERCFNSVESADYSDKDYIQIHWLSPAQQEKDQVVRFRATVAENKEAWYTGDKLEIVLHKDDSKPLDRFPYPLIDKCNLCSEARYELLFKGRWSRMSHPRHYPTKPDENGYSHMIGASHAVGYKLWHQGDKASDGLKLVAEKANISLIEREIIEAMQANSGTRTLIRGKKRHHPHMLEPSHSLFRVDRFHHLFSFVVAMKPSPDWFLGVSQFELCSDEGWLKEYEIPLYPWDAGTMDGISYESPPSLTSPGDVVKRVAVGSFDEESPFYQMSLIDLKAFAFMQVRRLAEYQLVGVNCTNDEDVPESNQEQQ
ncbi:spondin-1-like [Epargyreus clarus]|uniref:spondin-1-like n=1 Tax=Epargyreus clarus TaxID=520877 RepID=UPI003C2C81A8